ncbi:MAG: chemotaxis protein CheW [Gammaproteobacteria bacterium]|nr:chemotaxis protein CheW [Gammaproteobacteria bacterium]
MTVSNAWLLEASDSLSIAISDAEMVEYVQVPVSFTVPGAPNYCNQILYWQSHLVPVMDLGRLLGFSADEEGSLLSLIAYQTQPGTALQYMALKLKVAPRKIQVDDKQACELPEAISEGLLSSLCLSCFTHENRSVLILDIASLCSAKYRDQVNESKSDSFKTVITAE